MVYHVASEEVYTKGQIKSKGGLVRRRFSQKTNEQICFPGREE